MCPLARQGDFYVPEMKELERKSRAAAAEAEDAQTDITGIHGLRLGSVFRLASALPKSGVLVSPVLLPEQAERGQPAPTWHPATGSQHTSSPHPGLRWDLVPEVSHRASGSTGAPLRRWGEGQAATELPAHCCQSRAGSLSFWLQLGLFFSLSYTSSLISSSSVTYWDCEELKYQVAVAGGGVTR